VDVRQDLVAISHIYIRLCNSVIANDVWCTEFTARRLETHYRGCIITERYHYMLEVLFKSLFRCFAKEVLVEMGGKAKVIEQLFADLLRFTLLHYYFFVLDHYLL